MTNDTSQDNINTFLISQKLRLKETIINITPEKTEITRKWIPNNK